MKTLIYSTKTKSFATIVGNANPLKFLVRCGVVRSTLGLNGLTEKFSTQEVNLYNYEDDFVSDSYQEVIKKILDKFNGRIIGVNINDRGELNIYGYGGISLGHFPIADSLEDLFTKNPIKFDSRDLSEFNSLKDYLHYVGVIRLSFHIRFGKPNQLNVSRTYNSSYDLVKLDKSDSKYIPRSYYKREDAILKEAIREVKSLNLEEVKSWIKSSKDFK